MSPLEYWRFVARHVLRDAGDRTGEPTGRARLAGHMLAMADQIDRHEQMIKKLEGLVLAAGGPEAIAARREVHVQ